MARQAIQLRAPLDLAGGAVLIYNINVGGALSFTLEARSTDAVNSLASIAIERKTPAGDGWQTIDASDLIQTGDAGIVLASINNSLAPSTISAGRSRTYRPPGNGRFPFGQLRARITNGAGLLLGLEIWVVIVTDQASSNDVSTP